MLSSRITKPTPSIRHTGRVTTRSEAIGPPSRDASTPPSPFATCDPSQAVSRLWGEPRPSPTTHASPTHACEDDRLLVVTIQPRHTFDEALPSGSLLGAPWEAVPEEMTHAYTWMCERLAERTPRRPLSRAPLWAWASISPQRLVASLTEAAAREPVCLVRAAVPRRTAILSAFDAWHHALNHTWCPAPSPDLDSGSEPAYVRFLADADQVMGRSDWSVDDLPDALRVRVEASWRWALVPDLYPDQPVQVAMTHLDFNDILGVVEVAAP